MGTITLVEEASGSAPPAARKPSDLPEAPVPAPDENFHVVELQRSAIPFWIIFVAVWASFRSDFVAEESRRSLSTNFLASIPFLFEGFRLGRHILKLNSQSMQSDDLTKC